MTVHRFLRWPPMYTALAVASTALMSPEVNGQPGSPPLCHRTGGVPDPVADMAITDSWPAPQMLSLPSAVVMKAVAPFGESATPQPLAWMLGFQAVSAREAASTEAKL